MTQEEYKNLEFKKKAFNKKKNKISSISSINDTENLLSINKKQLNIKNTNLNEEYDELNYFIEKQINLELKNKSKDLEQKLLNDDLKFCKKVTEENSKTNLVNLNDNINSISSFLELNETNEFLSNFSKEEKNYSKNSSDILNDKTKIFNKYPLKGENIENLNGSDSILHMQSAADRLRSGLASVIDYSKEETFLNKKRNFETKLTKNSIVEDSASKNLINEDSNADSNIDTIKNDKFVKEEGYGKGIFLALEEFRRKKLLGLRNYLGRNKDSILGDDINGKNDKINITYIDERGNHMTKKQAFRDLCYQFHNTPKGNKRQEKILQKQEMQNQIANRDNNIEARTLQYLKKEQQKNNVPYAIFQGKNNIMKY